jgi:isopenicillin N synthase-like dioxygenase
MAIDPSQGVPLVDLRDWSRGDDALREAFVQTVGDAIKHFGFVRVGGHDVRPYITAPAYAAARAFFALPADVKADYIVKGGRGQRGYTPFGAEHAKDNPAPDLKEFWHVGRELPADHPLAAVYPRNLWPTQVEGFRKHMLELYEELERVSVILLRALALYLGEDERVFTDLTDGGNTVMRSLRYPPLEGLDVQPGSVRAAAHEDINFITLLITSTASGLELLDRDGKWLAVDAQPGEIVADSGDMLHRVTNGVIPATTHRVVNPDDAKEERMSMPFFVHPRPNAMLRVLESCRGEGMPTPPPDISGQDFLEERLAEIGLSDM